MSRRKDPAAAVIEFFEHASIEAAQTVLGIGKSIVKRRQAAAGKSPAPPADGGLTPAQAAGFAQAESKS
jgi:hypothetical protein